MSYYSLYLGCLMIFGCILMMSASGHAAVNRQETALVIENHLFEPAEIAMTNNTVLKLIIYNHDSTVEEFESIDLKREKIVPANGKVVVSVGPLKPGIYKFFGEFHPETAQGIISVK